MKNTKKVLVDTFDIEIESTSPIFIRDTAFLLTWGQKVSG